MHIALDDQTLEVSSTFISSWRDVVMSYAIMIILHPTFSNFFIFRMVVCITFLKVICGHFFQSHQDISLTWKASSQYWPKSNSSSFIRNQCYSREEKRAYIMVTQVSYCWGWWHWWWIVHVIMSCFEWCHDYSTQSLTLVHGSYPNRSDHSRRATVINVFMDGVMSDSDEVLLNGVPSIPKVR